MIARQKQMVPERGCRPGLLEAAEKHANSAFAGKAGWGGKQQICRHSRVHEVRSPSDP